MFSVSKKIIVGKANSRKVSHLLFCCADGRPSMSKIAQADKCVAFLSSWQMLPFLLRNRTQYHKPESFDLSLVFQNTSGQHALLLLRHWNDHLLLTVFYGHL